MITLLNILFGISPTISAIAHTIIAIVNIVLLYNIFVVQKNENYKKDIKEKKLQLQGIKLIWFKELIIQEKWHLVEKFFSQLKAECKIFNSNNLSNEDKMRALEKIKDDSSELRKSFIDLLKVVNAGFQAQFQSKIDQLIDGLTENIFDESINLAHLPTFEEKIEDKITYANNDVLKLIFSYKGE